MQPRVARQSGLEGSFTWGSDWAVDDVKYLGRRIIRDPASGEIDVTQEEFVNSMTLPKISAERGRDKMDILTPEERMEFRSGTGDLQWLAGASRPDAAAPTSLLQSGSPTVADFKALVKLIERIKATPRIGVKVRPLKLKDLILVAYGDSSFANAKGSKSQGGLLVIATTRRALFGRAPGSLLEWRSHRIPRSTRSTLSSEACAADAACDHGFFVGWILSELVHGVKPRLGKKLSFDVFLATDCKSLFDALVRLSSSLQDKRTQIEVQSIKELISKNGVRWVPTDEQHADPLTKLDGKLEVKMRAWMSDPYCQLREPPAS